jgi:hypothetical protein
MDFFVWLCEDCNWFWFMALAVLVVVWATWGGPAMDGQGW